VSAAVIILIVRLHRSTTHDV